jgi:hypothetical protein
MGMKAYLVPIDAKLFEGFVRDPSTVGAYVAGSFEPPQGSLRLGKMWHGIHFLLSGQSWSAEGPLGQAVMGGADIGPDIGYGPARMLTPTAVREISSELSKVSGAELKTRFTPSAMDNADLYPGPIWGAEKDTILAELVPLFEQLVALYAAAAARNDAMLLWVR